MMIISAFIVFTAAATAVHAKKLPKIEAFFQGERRDSDSILVVRMKLHYYKWH